MSASGATPVVHEIARGAYDSSLFLDYQNICSDHRRAGFDRSRDSFRQKVEHSAFRHLLMADAPPQMLQGLYRIHLLKGGCPEGTTGHELFPVHLSTPPIPRAPKRRSDGGVLLDDYGIRILFGAEPRQLTVNGLPLDAVIPANNQLGSKNEPPRMAGHAVVADREVRGPVVSFFGQTARAAVVLMGPSPRMITVITQSGGRSEFSLLDSRNVERNDRAWAAYFDLLAARATGLKRHLDAVVHRDGGWRKTGPKERSALVAAVERFRLEFGDDIAFLSEQARRIRGGSSWGDRFLRARLSVLAQAFDSLRALLVEIGEKPTRSVDRGRFAAAAHRVAAIASPLGYLKALAERPEVRKVIAITSPGRMHPLPARGREAAFHRIFDAIIHRAGEVADGNFLPRNAEARLSISWDAKERELTISDEGGQPFLLHTLDLNMGGNAWVLSAARSAGANVRFSKRGDHRVIKLILQEEPAPAAALPAKPEAVADAPAVRAIAGVAGSRGARAQGEEGLPAHIIAAAVAGADDHGAAARRHRARHPGGLAPIAGPAALAAPLGGVKR